MSIAGTIPVLLCFLLFLIQRDSYNFLWGRKLLLAGVFFFLVPVQLMRFLLPMNILPEPVFSEETQLYLSHSMDFLPGHGDEYVWFPRWISVIILLWAGIVILFALYQFIKYRKIVRKINRSVFYYVDEPKMELVYYVVPDGSCGPCTVGFFRQKIIIPESFTELENFSMVYQHEYTHLKNRDNLVKLLCLIVLCIHWMNPAAYLLLFLYRITAEAVSDDAAVLGYSKDIVKSYAMLLVTTTPVREKLPVVWKNNFSSEGKMIKRRINYMMKKRKNGWMRKGIIAMVSALTIAASAGTVLAYEPMQWSDGSVGESIVLDESDMSNFDFLSGELNDIDFSKTDTVFVTENGIQIPIMDNDSSRVLCKHNMVNGYLHNHTSNSSGGCTVKTYTCQRCTRCGYLANAKYYSTTNYAKCPHK
ncbi:M56 family metallopeptidase [Blautia difficilis]|uniref:M56 family metallopeptidase n=1 Tax=Blautia difficilis TaxID=2763027 RepID=A0ABR7IJS2_9FIRM|nr:M56 family metallopeptidase [Blautia difficilis]MBC5780200.1 M56 family metallopeptidase [Blautia difficilis]